MGGAHGFAKFPSTHTWPDCSIFVLPSVAPFLLIPTLCRDCVRPLYSYFLTVPCGSSWLFPSAASLSLYVNRFVFFTAWGGPQKTGWLLA